MSDIKDKSTELPPSAYDFYRGDSLSETHSDSSLENYERELGFSRDKLQGKIVLDLGTGRTDRFARELKESGIDAEVISLSPDLLTSASKNDLKILHPEWRRIGALGIAQQLPFRDGTFDMVLSLYSVTYYTWAKEQMQAWVNEIGRVLKPGGQARLAPTYEEDKTLWGENFEKLKNATQTARLSFSVAGEGVYKYFLFTKPDIGHRTI